ncbi:hypothetical protein ACFL0P_05035 [Candidatus Omnitrophota bacterium]
MDSVTPESKLLDLIKKAQGKIKLKKELKIFTKINIALIVLIVLVLGVFLIDVFTFDYKVPEVTINSPIEKEEDLLISSDFDEDVNEDAEIVFEKDVSVSKDGVIKDLHLLGIIAGDDVQAIIEDRETGKTFFVYQGDSFEKITVHRIRDSKVILDYKGDKIELNM